MALICGIAGADGWPSNVVTMCLWAILAIVFWVQAPLIADIVPRTPELQWPEAEEFPRPPLVIPTLTISTNDVKIASVMVLTWPPRKETAVAVLPGGVGERPIPAPPVETKFSLKWAYSEEGARRVREFTEAHIGQRIQIRIGAFKTPPTMIHHANRSGRDGMHGISDADAKAIFVGLGGNEEHGSRWWPR